MARVSGRGFTVVELLIVIVIIAILATTTIVTYSGIQERAYNLKIIANVSAYREAIELYQARHGVFPMTTPEENEAYIAVVCLGTGYDEGAVDV